MNIYPAIDLRGGRVVRLRQGDPLRQTIFSSDPIAVAEGFATQGATWLHVINLDGAFGAESNALMVLSKLAKLPLCIQFGGGVRTMEAAQAAFAAGADRVIIGTAAFESPDFVPSLLQVYGAEHVAVALDARDGKVSTRGWQSDTGLTPIEAGQALREHGLRYALFTDVSRDGLMMGASLEDTLALARSTGLSVIASGGVTSRDEIAALAAADGIEGAVIGMALYEGLLTLEAALEAAGEGRSC